MNRGKIVSNISKLNIIIVVLTICFEFITEWFYYFPFGILTFSSILCLSFVHEVKVAKSRRISIIFNLVTIILAGLFSFFIYYINAMAQMWVL